MATSFPHRSQWCNTSLVPNHDKLKIDFDETGVIYLEGPPDQIDCARKAVDNEIARLSKDLSSEVVTMVR